MGIFSHLCEKKIEANETVKYQQQIWLKFCWILYHKYKYHYLLVEFVLKNTFLNGLKTED